MEDELKKVGIPCPHCQSFLHTPLEHVLFGSNFECSNCYSKFLLNDSSFQEIIRQLQVINFSF